MSRSSELLSALCDSAELPHEAAMVLTALEAAAGRENRRQHTRHVYRAQASLALFADGAEAPARVIYTRDVNERGIGFVTRERLPLGYGGVVRLAGPRAGGQVFTIPCTLFRCRLAAPGWYEGALHFNRDQSEFRPDQFAGEPVGEGEDLPDFEETEKHE